MTSTDQPHDTFPKLLARNARVRGGRPAMREKEYGIWRSYTWGEVWTKARDFAAGLHELGVRRGDKVAIVGDNRPRLYWTMVSAQMIGAVPVPLYQDAVAQEMRFVLDHSEAGTVVAEDQEQVDKLLEIKEECGKLKSIVFDDDRGMRNYDHGFLHPFDGVEALGRDRNGKHPDFLDGEIGKSSGSDTAIMLYTSGTTGRPKGVVLSYDNTIITARNGIVREGLREREDVLAYLPMAWVGDNLFSFAQSYVAGFTVNCPESGATVMTDLREIGPTYFFAPPRIFENILTQVSIRMEDAGAAKRGMFRYFMALARRVGVDVLDGKPVGAGDWLMYRLGEFLIYGPLKNALGLSRIRTAYTAGEAIGPDIFLFFRSIGVNLKQLYGSTEASVFITIQPDGEIHADTVGTPAIDVEIEIADDGEVLFRSPGVFVEYYKDPRATAAAKTGDGWVRTGDAGVFDERGHLRIIDRAKDVGRLRNGSLFAPKYLENKLKFFPRIKEAVAFGHDREMVCCLINIDLEAVGSWAERNGTPYASYQELAANPDVYRMIQREVEQVNRDLAREGELAGSQIRRFMILHKELDADDGELTRTRKIRRDVIADKYRPLVDALYSKARRARIETEVTYEDGRKGRMKADLEIRDAAIAPVGRAARAA